MALLVEPLGQLDRILQSAAGMGGDEVGDQILVLSIAAVELKILLTEFFVDLDMGFAHVV